MMKLSNVTLCLTIGKRPKELEQTLHSLFSFVQFQEVIAINDFGDDPTSEAFLRCCPDGKLIDLKTNLGHHRAVDYMYNQVSTDYIFHCEDDWLFDHLPDVPNAIALLHENPKISCISFRKYEDFLYNAEDQAKILPLDTELGEYIRVDHLHEQWYGYSFNPHIARKELWAKFSPFSQFKKERHISRHLRKQGYFMAFLKQGACHHIGHDSVSNPPKTFWQKLRFW